MSKRGENITKRKDGRWEARVIRGRDANGKALYYYLYAKSYREVKEKRNELISKDQNQRGKKYDAGEILVSSLMEDYLSYKKNLVKQSSYSRYKSISEKHICPDIGKLKLKELNSRVFNDFLAKKLESGRIDGRGGLSPKRTRDILSLLKNAMIYAEEIGHNLPFGVKIPFPKNNIHPVEILSGDEERNLIQYVRGELPDEKIGVLIALFTGMRIGEICALKWSDIDFNAEALAVSKTLQRVKTDGGRTEIKILSPKSEAGERLIPISESLMLDLIKCKAACGSDQAYVLTGSEKYIEPSNYYLKYQKWLKKCGVQSHTFHALRHTFATRYIEFGFDAKSLSEILGHSDVKITLSRYVHPSFEIKRKNIEDFSRKFSSQYLSQ